MTLDEALIFADSNDRPGGPVKAFIESAGFTNTCSDEPTALIGEERAAIDLLAVRGLRARQIPARFRVDGIPSIECPSDHIPVEAFVEL